MRIIDFHTHAFPDNLADRAIPHLEELAHPVKAKHKGTVSSLLRSMDDAGIEISVLLNVATKIEQFEPILDWSKQIASDRIIPFPSIHPDDPLALEHLRIIAEEGFKGIKLHPYHQNFVLDDKRMFSLYGEIEKRGLLLLCHTGYDIAFERKPIAGPVRVAKVAMEFPGLKMIAPHLGGWEDWVNVEKHLLGEKIYLDLSYTLNTMPQDEAKALIVNHPGDYLLFGTDSPWYGQKLGVEEIKALNLGKSLEQKIFFENARRLLEL